MTEEMRRKIIFRIAFAACATAISCAVGYWLVVLLMMFPPGAVAFIFLSYLFGIPAKAFPKPSSRKLEDRTMTGLCPK